MRGFWVLAVAAALAGGVAPAHAGLNFDFSFSNTTGGVSGTVTGEIFGLADNTTSGATDVVIDSYPAGLSLPAAPWDVFNAAGFSIFANSFTVAGGVVTGADFLIAMGVSHLGLNSAHVESSLEDANLDTLANRSGFSGITFTPVSSSTSAPEPASIALLMSGLFGLRLIRRQT